MDAGRHDSFLIATPCPLPLLPLLPCPKLWLLPPLVLAYSKALEAGALRGAVGVPDPNEGPGEDADGDAGSDHGFCVELLDLGAAIFPCERYTQGNGVDVEERV
jgi:hypothetical protein